MEKIKRSLVALIIGIIAILGITTTVSAYSVGQDITMNIIQILIYIVQNITKL